MTQEYSVSTASRDTSEGAGSPVVNIPRNYNAADDLIGRNLLAGRGGKLAIRDDQGEYTYAQVAERVNRCANILAGLGVTMEARVFVALYDSIDFPTVFLGCIKAGVVPIAANTLLTTADYDFMLQDSRASVLIVSAGLLPALGNCSPKRPTRGDRLGAGAKLGEGSCVFQFAGAGCAEHQTAPTTAGDICFWLSLPAPPASPRARCISTAT